MNCYYCGNYISGNRGVYFINKSAGIKERFCNRTCKEKFVYSIQRKGFTETLKICKENQNKSKSNEIIMWSK